MLLIYATVEYSTIIITAVSDDYRMAEVLLKGKATTVSDDDNTTTRRHHRSVRGVDTATLPDHAAMSGSKRSSAKSWKEVADELRSTLAKDSDDTLLKTVQSDAMTPAVDTAMEFCESPRLEIDMDAEPSPAIEDSLTVMRKPQSGFPYTSRTPENVSHLINTWCHNRYICPYPGCSFWPPKSRKGKNATIAMPARWPKRTNLITDHWYMEHMAPHVSATLKCPLSDCKYMASSKSCLQSHVKRHKFLVPSVYEKAIDQAVKAVDDSIGPAPPNSLLTWSHPKDETDDEQPTGERGLSSPEEEEESEEEGEIRTPTRQPRAHVTDTRKREWVVVKDTRKEEKTVAKKRTSSAESARSSEKPPSTATEQPRKKESSRKEQQRDSARSTTRTSTASTVHTAVSKRVRSRSPLESRKSVFDRIGEWTVKDPKVTSRSEPRRDPPAQTARKNVPHTEQQQVRPESKKGIPLKATVEKLSSGHVTTKTQMDFMSSWMAVASAYNSWNQAASDTATKVTTVARVADIADTMTTGWHRLINERNQVDQASRTISRWIRDLSGVNLGPVDILVNKNEHYAMKNDQTRLKQELAKKEEELNKMKAKHEELRAADASLHTAHKRTRDLLQEALDSQEQLRQKIAELQTENDELRAKPQNQSGTSRPQSHDGDEEEASGDVASAIGVDRDVIALARIGLKNAMKLINKFK